MNTQENKKAIEALKVGFAGIDSMVADTDMHAAEESMLENSGTFGGWSFEIIIRGNS